MSTPIEDELRAVLDERADTVERTPDPWARTTKAIEVDRRHRRRVAGGVAAVLLAIGAGTGAALTAGPGHSHDATVPASTVSRGPAATGSVLNWAARGSLVADGHFLAAVRARLARVADVGARIVYAGDVAGHRVVLAVAPSAGQEGADVAQYTVWRLVGPARTGAARLQWGPRGSFFGTEHVVAWSPSTERAQATPLLVLTTSDVRTGRLSDAPRYATDGTVTRTWRTLSLANGVWVGRTGPKGPLMARIAVGGYDGPLRTDTGPATPHAPPGPASDLVTQFAADHGVAVQDVSTTIRYDGRVPGQFRGFSSPPPTRSTQPASLVYAVLRLPDGTAFRSARVTIHEPGGALDIWDPVDGAPVPAADAAALPLVFPDQGGSGRTTLHVIAPGASRAVLSGPGSQRLRVPLTATGAGAVTAPTTGLAGWPHGWTVTTQAAHGQPRRWPVELPWDDDPLDLGVQ